MALFLTEEKLKDWLGRIVQDRELFAPTLLDGLILFRKVVSPEEVVPDYEFTPFPPRTFSSPKTRSSFG